MAKPSPKKPVTKPPVGVKPTTVTQKKTGTVSNRWIYLMAFIIGCFGFIIYSNTLNHEYVLDDFSAIKENRITQGGVDSIPRIFKTSYRGGEFDDASGLYRPLSRVMFAVEWNMSDGNPAPFHWVNVLMYAFTCGFLFIVLYQYLRPNYIVPLIGALIFTFHPLHTEVVANIKSRDEILALLFLLISLYTIKKYIDKNRIYYLAIAAGSFFLGLLSKESSITFLAVIPLTIWFFTKAPARKNITVSLTMLVVVVLYLILHKSVIGSIGVDNPPVADNSLMASKSFIVQRMTAIYILGLYIKLLFFPHPLSCDYSFNQIPLVTSAGDGGFVLSLLFHMALVGVALWLAKKKSVISYGIFFYIITLSVGSNLITIIGTNMADRLLFIPSLGFALVIAALLAKLFKYPTSEPFGSWSAFFKRSPGLLALLVVVLVLYTGKTMSRNKDWKNVSTLFRADIKTVPNSAHMRLYYAGMITNEDSLAAKTPEQKVATLNEAIVNLTKGIEILDTFPDAHNQLAKCFKELGNFPEAEKHYLKCVEFASENATYHNNLATVYFATFRYTEAEKEFRKAIELNPACYPDALCNLGSVMGTYGEINRANGKADEAMKSFEESIQWFKKTLECDPEYGNALKFMAATYKNIGKEAEANIYQQKYDVLMAKKNKNKKK